ncbi:Uncharacterised protein [Zhongshania aliphaticivorans]|uniref:Uncharacterized protein n=1 Tax=Zhongshania aliphaticivorans TaxID=1470434 RepID=A0A5S9QP56_9GAMM|nr:hypothetical protein [Zhongshania aliphaticivorans]CAA0087458.1 Uncharacterised protein [Zhongshania aliphaticivorans]CAA0114909.1 Uncharacterised protein [Zhongshania aliphaticivorans]CAA0119708.1 Uncharacterised protein [Zhongshania aliphaticivorans]
MTKEKGPLLGELEEIKAALHKPRDIDLSIIPVLDDIIEDDLDRAADEPELSTTASQTENVATPSITEIIDPSHPQPQPANTEFTIAYSDDNNFERDIFIQEVIDAMMPEIESELRKRLMKLDDVTLDRWHSHPDKNN